MPHKNVLSLISSFKLLREELKDKYYLQIYDEIKKSGLEEKTVFIDFVSDRDLPILYSGAEIFIYPSLYEGFGLPPLEAMACGTPAISSNATSLPEVIDDSGILVDSTKPSEIKDAVEKLLNTPDLLNVYKKKGLEKAQMFSLNKTTRRLYEDTACY